MSTDSQQTTPAAQASALADRLHALSNKLRAHVETRPAYTPSSCESCLAACKNFVRLTFDLPYFNGNAPSSSPASSDRTKHAMPPTWGTSRTRVVIQDSNGEKHDYSEERNLNDSSSMTPSSVFGRELDPLLAAVQEDLDSTWRGVWGLVSSKLTSTAAMHSYKECLADCIDDYAQVYPAQVTECVARAKSEGEIAKCTEKIALDMAEFKRLEREARKLETKLNSSL